MKKILFIIFCVILFISNSVAEETKYGGAFLELGVGVRALGLGSAYVAVADDGSGFYWNPGGMAFVSQMQASLMYANLFNSLENHSYASFTMPIFGEAVVTASWIRLAVEDIPRYYDADLNYTIEQRIAGEGRLDDPSINSFNYVNNAYYITFSKLSRWDAELGWEYFTLPIDIGYGIGFKILDIGLDDKSASGIGVDGGLRVSMGLNDLFADDAFGKFSIGLSIQDIFNTKISWDTDSRQKDEIERNWKYGLAYLQPLNFINGEALFLLDFDSKYEGSTHSGFEFVYKKLVALRLGSNSGNFAAGAGFTYWKIKIDYAFQDHDLGNSHRVGTSFIF